MCFSCSGRIIIFVGSENVKKGCQWVVVQHKEIEDKDDTWSKIIEASENKSGIMTLKFEPFVSYGVDAKCFDYVHTYLGLFNVHSFLRSRLCMFNAVILTQPKGY